MKVKRGPDGVVTARLTAGYGRSNALPSVTSTRRIAETLAGMTDGDGWFGAKVGSICAPARLRAENRRKPSVTVRPSVILSTSHSRNEDGELDLPRCGCGARWQLSGCLSGNCRSVCRGAVGDARNGTCGPVAIGTGDGFAHTFPDSLADTRSCFDSNGYLQFNSYDLCLIVCVWVRALAQGSQLWPILSGVALRLRPGGGQKSGRWWPVGPRPLNLAEFFLGRVFSRARGK